MSAQKGFVPILMVLLIALAALAGGLWIYQSNLSIPPNPSPTPKVACTQEAKLCPDGSSVGRTGPNCEFATCPTPESTSSAETANWKTIKNTAFSWDIKYPSDWEILTPECDLPAGKCSNVMMRGTNIFNGECSDPEVRCGHLSVDVVVPHTGNVSASISAKQYVESFEDSSTSIVEPSIEVIINGETGYQQTVQNSPGSSAITRVITILHNGKIYYLSMTEGYYQDNYNIHATKDWKLLNIFNQILSTFKFLDQNALDQSDGNCQPRPACLDAITTPRCLMPEPAGGWCP